MWAPCICHTENMLIPLCRLSRVILSEYPFSGIKLFIYTCPCCFDDSSWSPSVWSLPKATLYLVVCASEQVLENGHKVIGSSLASQHQTPTSHPTCMSISILYKQLTDMIYFHNFHLKKFMPGMILEVPRMCLSLSYT